MTFLHAGGTIVENASSRARPCGWIPAAWSPSRSGVEYDIKRAGNLKSMFFGGEGLFLASLSGHGKVWLQSLPFSRLADRVIANAPRHGGSSTGEGSVLGGLGRLIGGDNS